MRHNQAVNHGLAVLAWAMIAVAQVLTTQEGDAHGNDHQ